MITLDGTEFKSCINPRSDIGHKGSFGTLSIIAGCKNYQGAATIAATAAARAGVGLVVSFIPRNIYIPFASKVSCAVIEFITLNLLKKLKSRRTSAILCGCGLSKGFMAKFCVKTALKTNLPLVIDADGITILAKNKSLLNRTAPTVLTPHIAEFSRLCGKSVDQIKQNPEQILTEFCVKHNTITVLKDYKTYICDQNGTIYCLNKPTSALSKGGSGDALAGILASFMAQGNSALNSAIAAVTLHNKCAHIAAQTLGAGYCLPQDIIAQIPKG